MQIILHTFFCCFFIFKSVPAHTSYEMVGILTLFHSLRQKEHWIGNQGDAGKELENYH